MKNKKVVFMGTPDFAVPILEGLIENTDVVLVVTQPDKLVGRKKILTASPIKEVALKNNIPVFQPVKIKTDYDSILDWKPDIIITCAYGQIIPKILLETPQYKAINVHASLLPKYRGGAPIHRAIINGEEKTGITIMYMDENMDTGNIITYKECEINKDDNVGTLHDKLSMMGKELLLETLPSIFSNTNQSIEQNSSLASYAPVIKREDEKIVFFDKGKNIINRIRGLNPWPLAYFLLNQEEIKVSDASFVESINQFEPNRVAIINKNELAISCEDGLIYLKMIKPNGKKFMNIKDYLNGIAKEKIKKEGVING